MSKSIDEILWKIPKLYLIAAIVLVSVHIILLVLVNFYESSLLDRIGPLFYLGVESNFPSWFSSMILLSGSLMLFILYKITSDTEPDKFWAFLSVVFVFLSMDEAISLHEHFIWALRERYNLTGFFFFGWVIPGIAFVAIVGSMSIPFLRRLPPKVATHLMIAGGAYVFGAVGFEMIGGFFYERISEDNYTSEMYRAIATVEESLEMGSIIFFNYVLIRYMRFIIKGNDEY